MPSTSLGFRQIGNDSVMMNPRGHVNSNRGAFDVALSGGLGLEEWDDWMGREGATSEVLPSSIERSESMESSVSSSDTWAIDPETSGVNLMSTSYVAGTDFPFTDAPFELEDFSRLSKAEERRLQNIAMPYYAISNIKIASEPAPPVESLASLSPSPEPELRKRKNNKRKSVGLGEQPSTAKDQLSYQSRKRGHNAIEKRYRTNLNAKIELLREGIPSIYGPNDNVGKDDPAGEGDDKPNPQKYGKAAVLMRALEYIQHLEKTTQRLSGEVNTLKTCVGAFENGNSMNSISRLVTTKGETLESIQSDFQQIQPIQKAVTGPATRR
ncbi:hypothetical protein BKA61DRAFT_343393 [Leptodontidium sp. MPI-SDFR-AT-0119]|nr:hypothetical protein BKA61DRAFT_343393 [Leptodontidium sp. MPI-SDFR-AT-0119]